VTGLRIAEIAVAGGFAVLGVRSFVHWIRRPLDSRVPRDQVLYALYRTGRIGLWFAVGGIFLISALTPGERQFFADRFARFRWYILVPLGMGILQLAGAYLLGRGGDDHRRRADAESSDRRD